MCKLKSENQPQTDQGKDVKSKIISNDKLNFLKNSFILDTRSTLSATIMNKDLVTDIKKAKVSILMMTNAGSETLDTEATIPNFGKAMLDTSQTANILGFSYLVKNLRVTYDSENEDAFIVHTKWGPLKFVN